MFTQFSNNIQAIILAFGGFMAFAVGDTTVKKLTEFYPIIQIIGFRSCFLLTLCLVLSPKLGGLEKTLKTKKLKFHLARGAIYPLLSFIIATSLSKLDLPIFYTIIFATPFVITILARIIFKESIGRHATIAIIIGFIGVFITMRPGIGNFNVWMILPLIATFLLALTMLLVKPFRNSETLLSLAFYPSLFNFLLFSIPVLIMYKIPLMNHIPLFFLSGTCGMIGMILTSLAYQRAKANIVAPIQYTQIVWGVVFSIILFGRSPDFFTFLGAITIVGAGIYLIKVKQE